MNGRKIMPSAKPTPLPNAFASDTYTMIPTIRLTMGINMRMIHHSGFPAMSRITTRL